MLNWKETYKSRLVAAEDAIKHIKSGDHVVLQHACGEPRTLIETMVERKDLRDVMVSHMAAIGPAEYAQEGLEENFRHNAFFAGTATRRAIHEGRADYTSCFFSELPRAYREHVSPDVALIHVSPPNKWGYCSLGVSVDYTKHVAEIANVVIAQVNEKMPKTYGDSFVHVNDIDFFVESTRDLIEIPIPNIGEVEKAIGQNVAGLIEDGSTMQLGIGAIPDAVLNFLHDKKDLGIHTEMFSDGVIGLVEKGIINGKAKSIHPGKIVCSFVMGTSKLYDFVDDNPAVEFYTIDYTNDPYVIGKHDKMISINSAIQVDLLGQVCADTIGHKQYSAVGGQVDFVRGTSRSRGGKAIIAMPSTAGGGKYSRIVSLLDEGAAVTTSRYDVQFVVTEFGVADLRVKTNRQRAEELIKVSHPDFRTELKAFAIQRKLF